MTQYPKRPCAWQGCHEYALPGKSYCEVHQKQWNSIANNKQKLRRLHERLNEERKDFRERSKLYNNDRWKRSRALFLQLHPWCEECKKQGKLVPATDVDHIVSHRGDMSLFWDMGNWQALCHECHARKTYRETLGKAKGRGRGVRKAPRG